MKTVFRSVDGETLLAIMEEDKNERSHQLVPRHSQLPESPFSHFFQVPPDSKNFSFSRSVSIQTTQRPDGVNIHSLDKSFLLIMFSLFYRFGKLVKQLEMVMEMSR